MAGQQILVDSGFLFALADLSDNHHTDALQFATTVDQSNLVVPDITLTEVTHLLKKAVGPHAVPIFLEAFTSLPAQLEPITMPDVIRATEIMSTYPEARFDFVDCCIMALSERLNITRICTFDRRDFAIFRPTHCAYLELLP